MEVIPGGTADKMKMKRGEVILNVNGKPVQTEDGIRHVLAHNPTFCGCIQKTPVDKLRYMNTSAIPMA